MIPNISQFGAPKPQRYDSQDTSTRNPKYQEIQRRAVSERPEAYSYDPPSKKVMNKGINPVERLAEKMGIGNADERNAVKRARNNQRYTEGLK
jgi:hypothetical protein